MTYLDVWRCGTFDICSRKNSKKASALLIINSDHRTTERSTSDSLGDISWIQKAALQLYRRNVPLLHTSRYVIPCDSVLPAFPRISTASDKRWGEKAWVLGYCNPTRHSHKTLMPLQSHRALAWVIKDHKNSWEEDTLLESLLQGRCNPSLVPRPSHPSICRLQY